MEASRQQSPANLPPEMTDVILDQLHDDSSSLLTCALVSKAFLPRARSNLFKSLVIVPKDTLREVSASYSLRGTRAISWEGFIKILNHSDPPLSLQYTRHLIISTEYPRAEFSVDADRIQTILRHMPSLVSLYLRALVHRLCIPHRPLLVLGHSKPALQTMTIHRAVAAITSGETLASFASFYTIYDLLCVFSHIEHLEIANTSYNMDFETPLPTDDHVSAKVVEHIRIAFPTLSSVRFNYTYRPASFFFYTVVRLSSAHTLRKLCVIAHQDVDNILLSQLLREATALEELYLDLESILQQVPYINPSTCWESLDLSRTPSLRRFYLPIYIPYRNHRETFDIITSLISTIPSSSSLRILGLPLNITPISHSDSDAEDIDGEPERFEPACSRIFATGLDWSALARNLTARPHLEEVAIGVITKSAEGEDIPFEVSSDLFDALHQILREKLVSILPERIRVRIQHFTEGEF